MDSWHLGSRVPPHILGHDGYLPRHQSSLESLSLITDCFDDAPEDPKALDLSTFRQLRRFSWIGLRRREEFRNLRDCLKNNAGHLKTLELGFVDGERSDTFWLLGRSTLAQNNSRSDNFFARDTGALQHERSGLRFLALEDLSLSALSFESAAPEISSAFRFCNLRQLKLWNCLGTMDLLDHIVDSQQTPRLVWLEIVLDVYDEIVCEVSTVSRFLQTFSGLEDLYFLLPVLNMWELAPAIANHLSTIRRFVLHARTIDISTDPEWFDDERDEFIGWSTEMSDLFRAATCDLVGMSNPPRYVQECLAPIAGSLDCRMLHLRVSGDVLERTSPRSPHLRRTLHDFAEWAFGADGMPNLEVIAYGNFAFPNVRDDRNALLCRNDNVGESSPSFQTLEPSNERLWNWVQSHMDALSSCCYRPITSF